MQSSFGSHFSPMKFDKSISRGLTWVGKFNQKHSISTDSAQGLITCNFSVSTNSRMSPTRSHSLTDPCYQVLQHGKLFWKEYHKLFKVRNNTAFDLLDSLFLLYPILEINPSDIHRPWEIQIMNSSQRAQGETYTASCRFA
jgi:hypothetical protein